MTPLQTQRQEKRRILRGEYGGMMTLTDLTRELGFTDPKSARRWVKEAELPATMICGRKRYDTDEVAKRLVDRRGFAPD